MLPFGDEPGSGAVSVSLFIAQMNGALKAAFPSSWVKGEVGEWKVWPSGHAYFTLKDQAACLPAMMWAEDVARLPFRVEPGLSVLARGKPDVYAPKGRLSFVVLELQPVGAGALLLAFEQLKKRLASEGLFDASKKRALPTLPRRIGLVTSRRSAVVRDILKVLSRRFPNANVTIYPVAVQGPTAAAEIARAVRAFSRVSGADVLIVARGGGSAEDLSAFNDERVVRAVASSTIPTVSAVGHEIDVTLTDLAADVRAATPSQAAELVVAQREEFESQLQSVRKEIVSALRSRLHEVRAELMALSGSDGVGGFRERVTLARERTESLSRTLLSSVRNLPAVFGERLLAYEVRLGSWPERAALQQLPGRIDRETRVIEDGVRRGIARASERLAGFAARLSSLDPLAILARGYAVAYKDGETGPLTDASRLSAGDGIRLVLARGEVRARVESTAESRAELRAEARNNELKQTPARREKGGEDVR